MREGTEEKRVGDKRKGERTIRRRKVEGFFLSFSSVSCCFCVVFLNVLGSCYFESWREK